MRSLTSRRPHPLLGTFLTGLLIAAPTARATPGDATASLREAWRLGAQARLSEAEAALPKATEMLSGMEGSEELEFTAAVLLLTRQPRSAAAIDRASVLLSALAKSAATPDLRARARYFQARATDLHQSSGETDPSELYRVLWREHPAHPFGQRALIHLLMLALYVDQPRATILARVDELEREGTALTDRVVLSQFHQVAARGLLHLGGENRKALDHLLAVDQLGVVRTEARGDLHVSIGELAAEQGRSDLARRHYEAFLQEFPRDPRAFTVRAHLAALPP